ncbi:hypothetical protein Ppa06_02030 [Planomonospora parontospora subsp. parontospora]|uniref:Uncharacterized protein n=2 Tax=Planomonospora parontospora TaxID=58119 RepID=A0AA37BBJ1_9ACTN|nr:hypothetical protein GCM10010126_02040 [Planomonospora parontospora]GII06405.1 hypothetical protein Ppa06_02030 [Planomonospora parontospora subsp. parontospora]
MRRRLAISALAALVTALFAVSVNATAAGAASSAPAEKKIVVQYGPAPHAE